MVKKFQGCFKFDQTFETLKSYDWREKFINNIAVAIQVQMHVINALCVCVLFLCLFLCLFVFGCFIFFEFPKINEVYVMNH